MHLASFSSYLGGGRLVIEDFAGVSSGSRIYTGTDDFLGESLTGPTIPEAPAARCELRHVGKYAVVGANCVVLPGVTLGEGCTVGALSLVNRDCEPWTIYGGSPRGRSRRGATAIADSKSSRAHFVREPLHSDGATAART